MVEKANGSGRDRAKTVLRARFAHEIIRQLSTGDVVAVGVIDRDTPTRSASVRFEVQRELDERTAPRAPRVLQKGADPPRFTAALDARTGDELFVGVPLVWIDAADALGEPMRYAMHVRTLRRPSTVESEGSYEVEEGGEEEQPS